MHPYASTYLSQLTIFRSQNETSKPINVVDYMDHDQKSGSFGSDETASSLSASSSMTKPASTRKGLRTHLRRVSFEQHQFTRKDATEGQLQEGPSSSTRSLYSGDTDSTKSTAQLYTSSESVSSDDFPATSDGVRTVPGTVLLATDHTLEGEAAASIKGRSREVDASRKHVATLKHQLVRLHL